MQKPLAISRSFGRKMIADAKKYDRVNADRWSTCEKANLDDLLVEGKSRTAFLLRFTLSHPTMSTTIVVRIIWLKTYALPRRAPCYWYL